MTQKPTLRTLTAGFTALALTLTLTMTPAQAVKTTYEDVDEDIWYFTSVAFCQQHQLMDGLSRRSFAPDSPMTRAALAEALYRLAGRPAPDIPAEEAPDGKEQPQEESSPFPDVSLNHPNLKIGRAHV